MVDIQAATATLTSTAATAPSSSAGLTAIQVAVADLSQNLQNLSRSIQTNATPVALSDNGNSLTLITALGSVTVTLGQQLGASEKQNLTQVLMNLIQTQRPLTLTLQPGAPPTQAVLLVSSAPLSAPSAPLLPQLQNVPPPVLATGASLSAVVLPSSATPILPQQVPVMPAPGVSAQTLTFAPPETLPMMPPTTQVSPGASPTPQTLSAAINMPSGVTPSLAPTATLQRAGVAPQVVDQAPTLQSPVPSTAPPASFVANPSLSQSLPALSSLLKPGNEVTIQIISILPSDLSSAPTSLPALAPNQIMASVTRTGSNGNLILQAGDAALFVKTQTSLPVGTNLVISVTLAKEAPPLTLPLLEQSNFPSLPQVLATLAQVAPQSLAQIMSGHIPQPTENLPGALMFLFSAFKQGNVRGWLGNEASETLLNAGKNELLASLSRELSEAGQPVQDPIVGEWHTYPIPLFTQQQFQALTLYVHSDRDQRHEQDNASPAPNKIRFLIDMKLSKLGAMQIDGLIQTKKLDMILRSETILLDGLHRELRTSYTKALGAVGYSGSLNFQVGRRHWMMMQQSAPSGIVT